MLVGVAGKKRSGKGTFASYFKNKGWKERAFANPLKQTMENTMGFKTKNEDDREKNQLVTITDNQWFEAFGYWGVKPKDRWELCQQAKRLLQPWFTVESNDEVSYFISYRKFIQTIGTDLMRGYDDNIWIMFQHSRLLIEDNVVFSDVRFDNEARWIKKYGGMIIKVEGEGEADGHSSEQGINEKLIDVFVKNDGTLEEYNEEIEKVYKVVEECLN
jgi:hypothetical protein